MTMLLNEFLKEHRKNEEHEATIARQQKQIEALTAGLQKMSAKIEMTKLRRRWSTITDNLSKAGWSWGCVSGMDSRKRRIFVVNRATDAVNRNSYSDAERIA